MKTQTATATLYTESTRPMLEIEKEETKDTAPRFWQAVLVGGIPGILIGSSATSVIQSLPTTEVVNSTDVESSASPIDEVVEVQLAHSVTNDMSFNQAFAAARAEIGPGGAFVWHGNVYTTFRADDAEWQEMSDEARAEFGQNVISQVECPPYSPTQNEPEIVAMDNADESDVDVHIVGVGQVELESGGTAIVGYGAVDGHYSEFIDTDGDGEVDTVLIDANDNRSLDPDEIIDAEGSGITVDDMVADAVANNGMALDDIVNPEAQEFVDDSMNTLV